jgi:hypothetical protein
MPIAPYVAPSQPSSLEMTLPPITRSPVSKATPFNAITKPSFTLSDVLPPEILAQPKAPATVQVGEPWRDDDSDAAERTIFGAYSNGPALPFQAGEHDGRDPIKVSAPPSASNATNPSDNDSAGMTMFAFSTAPPSSVLPFQSNSLPSADAKAWAEMAEQVEFPTLSRSLVQKARELTSTESYLNAYASLCAELAAAPTDAEATFARYGLVLPEKRKAVDDAWKERLRRDPALYTQWQQFYRAAFERLKR